MPSIIILNKSTNSIFPYDQWLNTSDKELILLNAEESVADYQDKEYLKIETFKDYNNNDEVENRVLDLAKEHNIERLISVSEYDLVRAGRLRDQLCLQEGQTEKSALAFRDKTVMKRIAHEGGVAVPPFQLITSWEDINKFILEYGYPVVLKPVDGSGAEFVNFIDNEDDLSSFKTKYKQLSSNYEIEKYISGDLYHVDGMVLNGEIILCWSFRYIDGCSLRSRVIGSYMLDINDPLKHRLVEFVTHILNVLPTSEYTPFHAEVFHTPEDKLIFCEIASRIGGGRIGEMIHQSFGINPREFWVKLQGGVPIEKTFKQKPTKYSGQIMIKSKEGRCTCLPQKKAPSWVVESTIKVQLGKVYKEAKHTMDYIATFVVCGETVQQVIDRLDEVKIWFENECSWELTERNL
ncbi:ATP-grasp domain-containing protein [Chengkuizengella axinellae]|uniref:ATP-grasp domain-containing protein n=1 Tax=Chengkuizengella axinellae TaxID=3064388 RepID=A0ABT9IZW5_9BACL|nr:ATP-grasp domain-containing protein [Chengkuizengella sp. 2205SS18-9]MDP5274865.1 ATP-grasp domain-containing protein [Chengkuizengella sp. 2205SS18-9]